MSPVTKSQKTAKKTEIPEYDVAFIGQSFPVNDLRAITIEPTALFACAGEIGNFNLSYQQKTNSQQVRVANIVINLPYQEELPREVGQSLSDVSVNSFSPATNEPLIIIQDYPQLTDPVFSQKGLQVALQAREEADEREIYYFYQAMRFPEASDELFCCRPGTEYCFF